MKNVRPTPKNGNHCFDCGGFGPCDVCENEVSSAEYIALDLHRNGLLAPGCCEAVKKIIARHLVGNLQLAGASQEDIDAAAR